MPLYKTISLDEDTQVLIWKIEESLTELKTDINLDEFCVNRLKTLKSPLQQKQFLSIRQLLKHTDFRDSDLYYDSKGKPHLKREAYISVTHSFEFSAIITSRKPVGIDIEKQRDKILRIANKFTPLKEYNTLANHEAKIRKLTIVWGGKEAIYKILNIPGISFLNDIYIEDFNFEDKRTTGEVIFRGEKHIFNLIFQEFEGFTCVYAVSSLVL